MRKISLSLLLLVFAHALLAQATSVPSVQDKCGKVMEREKLIIEQFKTAYEEEKSMLEKAQENYDRVKDSKHNDELKALSKEQLDDAKQAIADYNNIAPYKEWKKEDLIKMFDSKFGDYFITLSQLNTAAKVSTYPDVKKCAQEALNEMRPKGCATWEDFSKMIDDARLEIGNRKK